jgi:hypothetical protein
MKNVLDNTIFHENYILSDKFFSLDFNIFYCLHYPRFSLIVVAVADNAGWDLADKGRCFIQKTEGNPAKFLTIALAYRYNIYLIYVKKW